MPEIFRKSSLEKLSSPEQLDKMIVITPPSLWISILGAALIVIVALLWSIYGRLAITVETQGIYIDDGITNTIVSETNGIISEILVNEYSMVQRGDVIARLDDADIISKINDFEERIALVDSVTINSVGDLITVDNKSLIDLKDQTMTINQSKNLNIAMYEMQTQSLIYALNETAIAEIDMYQKEFEYFDSLGSFDTTESQLAYSEAQSAYSTYSQYLESSRSTLSQYSVNSLQSDSNYDQAKSVYDSISSIVDNANSILSEKQELYSYYTNILNEFEYEEYPEYEYEYEEDEEEDEEEDDEDDEEEYEEDDEEVENEDEDEDETDDETDDEEVENLSYSEDIISLVAKNTKNDVIINTMSFQNNSNVQIVSFDYDASSEYLDYVVSCIAELDAWFSWYDEIIIEKANAYSDLKIAEDAITQNDELISNLQSDVSKYQSLASSSKSLLDNTRSQYIDKVGEQVVQNQSLNTYNTSVSFYTNAKAVSDNLETTVEQLKVQVNVDNKNANEQIEYITQQFNATKLATIDSLNREKFEYEQQLEKCNIIATKSGRVTSLLTYNGAAVGQGTPLISVRDGNEDSNVTILYTTVADGKKISEGMKVLLYPTTVNKQEYGHMVGIVTNVDDYVTSTVVLQEQLGDENLVNSFLNNGPVIAITCSINKDDSTVSGYKWSSSKATDIMISSGTLIEANVVTEEKAPITMIIPYIKDKLTVKVGD